jgi:formamidopyrimidine-DNA glycosylase
MPELPEVEVLVRHLRPLLERKRIHNVTVFRPKVIRPNSIRVLKRVLRGAKFASVSRRGKYLLFHLESANKARPFLMLGHLGMTGRMYLLPVTAALPKHTSVALNLGRQNFVFEDTRFFGRLTLDLAPVEGLGPEPLSENFSSEYLRQHLRRSSQPIKVKLLDQRLVAGVGNIYASEALFRAGIPPRLAARRLRPHQIERLREAIREVLAEAISCGSTVPLNYSGTGQRDGLFYFGRAAGAPDYYTERLLVYDREGRPCPNCGSPIKRLIQAARSTYFCPECQRGYGGSA